MYGKRYLNDKIIKYIILSLCRGRRVYLMILLTYKGGIFYDDSRKYR